MSAPRPAAVVYRAPMRAREHDGPAGAGEAVARGVVAIGPGPGARAESLVERFAAAPEGAFVWTRHSDGSYRLGRITGPCRAESLPAGLTHTRPAEWLDRPLRPDEIHPRIAYAFARGGRNFQRIRSGEAERWTEGVWPR